MYESQLQKTGFDVTAAALYKLRLISEAASSRGCIFFLIYVTIIKSSIIHCKV